MLFLLPDLSFVQELLVQEVLSPHRPFPFEYFFHSGSDDSEVHPVFCYLSPPWSPDSSNFLIHFPRGDR